MTNSGFRYVTWKRNINRIPAGVKAKLETELMAGFVVGVVKAISRADLASGAFRHLGIGVVNGDVSYLARITPLEAMGRYSTKNKNGWEVVLRDLPMITKTFYIETPNFGDWTNGSHELEIDREVYQRDYIDPPDCALLVELLHESDTEVAFKIVVDLSLDRRDDSFDEQLLFALNLLQENLGVCGVLPADAKVEQLLSTLGLGWQIFPPGTADEVVRRTIASMRRPTPEQQQRVRERVAMFNTLQPKHFLHGEGGMNSYVGALFSDDLVVFENVRYGNALYVLFDDWKEISKRSRIDLLRARDVKFDRFVHSVGWEDRFREFISNEKRKRRLNGEDTQVRKRV